MIKASLSQGQHPSAAVGDADNNCVVYERGVKMELREMCACLCVHAWGGRIDRC
jgi:hypothetical protein